MDEILAGDKNMKKMLATLLREEGKEEAKIEVYYNEMQLTPEEISEKMSIPLNQVIETIKTLQLQT